MEQHNLTLLILAAECSGIVWMPIASSKELLMDYATKFAVEAGCTNVVVTVCEAQKDIAIEHMNEISQKYSVSTAAITVDSRYNGSVNQIVAAEKEFSNSNFIVMNADCYCGNEAFEIAAKKLSESHSSCMIGDIPRFQLLYQDELYSDDKKNYAPYINSVRWDWRVKKNMFGFTAEAVKMIVDHYKMELDLAYQGPKQAIYASLIKEIPDLMQYYDKVLLADFHMIDFDKSFFQISNAHDLKYVRQYNDVLKKSLSGTHCCEYAELYFYQTEHNTIAVNFDAYAKCSGMWAQDYTHLHLEKPFDTGLTVSEINEIEKKQYEWECSDTDEKGYYGEKTVSSLCISIKNNSLYCEYIGEWIEVSCGKKYPMHLPFSFQNNSHFYIQRKLSEDEASTSPMLVLRPIFIIKNETKSANAVEYEDETEAPEKEVTFPNINIQKNSVCIEIVQDLDEDNRKEYEDVFDIPDEAKIVHYDTQGAFGTYSDDGIDLILKNGWNGQLDSNTKMIYFAYSFAYSDNGNIITSTEMMNETALCPKSIQNAPRGKVTDICKLYCRVENGKILDRAEHFNDGTYSEFCEPFRMFQALDKNASILAAVVVTKESDFVDFIEQTKKITTALKTKATVFEVMKRYQPIDV